MDKQKRKTIRRFEDIDAWQEARLLANEIYRLTSNRPFAADFVLRDQIRRAAISILSNIAEGFEREGNTEFAHFLSVAKGSCGEARAQIYLALDFGYIDEADHLALNEQAERVSRLLGGFMRYLQRSSVRGLKYRSQPSGQAPKRSKPETRNLKPET